MKHILSDRIVLADENPHDHQYLFLLPEKKNSPMEVNMSELLSERKNTSVDHTRDYKLWNQVYSPLEELAIFEELVTLAIERWRKIHISNVSLREEIEIIRKLYLDLGFFHVPTNRFEVDFANAPITIWVDIRNLIYSTKDYKSKRESICFIPPPRESGHIKALFAGLNSGVVSTIGMRIWEEPLLQEIVELEKTSLMILSNALYWNYLRRGFEVERREWVLQMT